MSKPQNRLYWVRGNIELLPEKKFELKSPLAFSGQQNQETDSKPNTTIRNGEYIEAFQGLFLRRSAITINKCNYHCLCHCAILVPTNSLFKMIVCQTKHSIPHQLRFVWSHLVFSISIEAHSHRNQVDSLISSYLLEEQPHTHKLNRIFQIVHGGTIDPIVHYFQSIFISFYEAITLKYGHHFSI